ncbi:MAG: hypothetical protein KA259_03335 [Caldilineaceae bacterium]|nr:hypothetical protein [Caldilineaceae bacterium]
MVKSGAQAGARRGLLQAGDAPTSLEEVRRPLRIRRLVLTSSRKVGKGWPLLAAA